MIQKLDSRGECVKPLEPHHVMHYLAACKVAGVPVAQTSVPDLRDLIDRISRLSIPDAAKLLRREARR